MSSLVEIIYALTQAQARMPVELPRGLHLVYYPPAGDQPCRLIAARYLSAPSTTELQVVRGALLEALDAHPSLVAVDVAGDWQETAQGDWNGYQITWRTLSTAGAFSPDDDLRRRVRLALEQRDRRQEARRDERQRKAAKTKKRPAAARGPKPML